MKRPSRSVWLGLRFCWAWSLHRWCCPVFDHAAELHRACIAGGSRTRAADRSERPDVVRAGRFVGLGAYTTAVLTTSTGLPSSVAWLGASPWLSLFAGLILTVAVATALGFLTLRLSGHYLPLGTIAWGISLYFLFGTSEMLGGHTGRGGRPNLAVRQTARIGPRDFLSDLGIRTRRCADDAQPA